MHQANQPLFVGTHPSFEDDLQQLTMLMSAKDKMIVNRTLAGGYDATSNAIDESIQAVAKLVKAKADWQAAQVAAGAKDTPL